MNDRRGRPAGRPYNTPKIDDTGVQKLALNIKSQPVNQTEKEARVVAIEIVLHPKARFDALNARVITEQAADAVLPRIRAGNADTDKQGVDQAVGSQQLAGINGGFQRLLASGIRQS